MAWAAREHPELTFGTVGALVGAAVGGLWGMKAAHVLGLTHPVALVGACCAGLYFAADGYQRGQHFRRWSHDNGALAAPLYAPL